MQSFAAGGGHIVYLSRTPSLTAGKNILTSRAAKATDFKWATFVPGELSLTPTPSDDPPNFPPTPQLVPASVVTAVAAAIPRQLMTLADTVWRVMPWRWRDADVVLLFNESAITSTHTITLATQAEKLESWNSETGETKPIKSARTFDGLVFTMTLEPYDTSVLVAR